jgi:hypothetical protein
MKFSLPGFYGLLVNMLPIFDRYAPCPCGSGQLYMELLRTTSSATNMGRWIIAQFSTPPSLEEFRSTLALTGTMFIDEMSQEDTPRDESQSFERFRRFVKRVISVPRSEIDRRAEEWKAVRETNKREESESEE